MHKEPAIKISAATALPNEVYIRYFRISGIEPAIQEQKGLTDICEKLANVLSMKLDPGSEHSKIQKHQKRSSR